VTGAGLIPGRAMKRLRDRRWRPPQIDDLPRRRREGRQMSLLAAPPATATGVMAEPRRSTLREPGSSDRGLGT